MTKRLLLLCGCILLTAGCGGGGKTAQVSGRITINGQPLAHAKVAFQPIGGANKNEVGPTAQGETDADGKYTLTLIASGKKGATVGENLVSISKLEGPPSDPTNDNPPPRPELVSPEWNTESKKKFTVTPDGTSKADFDVKPNTPQKKFD
jgi:hypothetical protein